MLCAYYMPFTYCTGIILFMVTISLWDRCYCSHFTENKINTLENYKTLSFKVSALPPNSEPVEKESKMSDSGKSKYHIYDWY